MQTLNSGRYLLLCHVPGVSCQLDSWNHVSLNIVPVLLEIACQESSPRGAQNLGTQTAGTTALLSSDLRRATRAARKEIFSMKSDTYIKKVSGDATWQKKICIKHGYDTERFHHVSSH